MVNIERLSKYGKLKSELAANRKMDTELNAIGPWPSKGTLEFKNVHMRYREDLEDTI